MQKNETLRCEWVRCGKCRSCPHGPYWYAYWREDGRIKKRYIGRKPPTEDEGPAPYRHWNAIFAAHSASLDLACEVLGCLPNARDIDRARRVHFRDGSPVTVHGQWHALVLVAAYNYLLAVVKMGRTKKKRMSFGSMSP